MFEKDILSSIRMVIDHAKGDRKISEVKMLSYSPKKSRDIIAPSYEDAVNNKNNVLSMKVFSSSESTCALSQQKEARTEVTPDLLKKILKSTAKAKNIDSTLELALKGKQDAMNRTVTSTCIKQLRSSCPLMTTLALQNLNLRAKQKNRRVRLVDLPANIERLSLRNSTFEPKSFFSKMDRSKIDKLQVLDLGRAIFIEDDNSSPEKSWPQMNSLEELYLEGAPHIHSSAFLETLLRNLPNLKVLDLEGTELNESDLVTIARLAPNLRELYLGCTNIKDISILQIVNSEFRFKKLEVICLCETSVTDLGLNALVQSCPSLRSITVKRSKVSGLAAETVKQILPGLQVRRVENTHIYVVFRNQGCDHFSSKYNVCTKGARWN